MRAFVLMVLALNIAFFAWQYISGLTSEGAAEEGVLMPAEVKSAAPSLELVSEVPSIVIDVKAAAPEHPPASIAVSQSPVVTATLDPVVAPVAEAKFESKPISDVTVGTPAEIAHSKLAGEVGQVDEVSPLATPLCYESGPFKQSPQALIAMAEEHGFAAAVVVRNEKQLVGEWIYLTEYETMTPARADVTALKAQGIEDVAIVRLDNGEIIISLGIYGKEASRQRRLDGLETLGYVNYQTRKYYRDIEAFWLVLSGFEGEQQQVLVRELSAALSERSPVAQLAVAECR